MLKHVDPGDGAKFSPPKIRMEIAYFDAFWYIMRITNSIYKVETEKIYLVSLCTCTASYVAMATPMAAAVASSSCSSYISRRIRIIRLY